VFVLKYSQFNMKSMLLFQLKIYVYEENED